MDDQTLALKQFLEKTQKYLKNLKWYEKFSLEKKLKMSIYSSIFIINIIILVVTVALVADKVNLWWEIVFYGNFSFLVVEIIIVYFFSFMLVKTNDKINRDLDILTFYRDWLQEIKIFDTRIEPTTLNIDDKTLKHHLILDKYVLANNNLEFTSIVNKRPIDLSISTWKRYRGGSFMMQAYGFKKQLIVRINDSDNKAKCYLYRDDPILIRNDRQEPTKYNILKQEEPLCEIANLNEKFIVHGKDASEFFNAKIVSKLNSYNEIHPEMVYEIVNDKNTYLIIEMDSLMFYLHYDKTANFKSFANAAKDKMSIESKNWNDIKELIGILL